MCLWHLYNIFHTVCACLLLCFTIVSAQHIWSIAGQQIQLQDSSLPRKVSSSISAYLYLYERCRLVFLFNQVSHHLAAVSSHSCTAYFSNNPCYCRSAVMEASERKGLSKEGFLLVSYKGEQLVSAYNAFGTQKYTNIITTAQFVHQWDEGLEEIINLHTWYTRYT